MKYEDFEREISRITKAEGYMNIYSSPDFQCEQSAAYPVSLCAAWGQEKAWLVPNETIAQGTDLAPVWQRCADFGIRRCADAEDFNRLLRELGRDAVESAEIPIENEPDMQM